MSRVELSLKEYDDLKEELRVYKEIVRAFTTIREPHDWEMDYYNDNPDSSLNLCDSVNDLPQSLKEFLENKITMSFKSLGIEGEMDDYTCCSRHIAYVSRKKEED